jgi:hypothetical protein
MQQRRDKDVRFAQALTDDQFAQALTSAGTLGASALLAAAGAAMRGEGKTAANAYVIRAGEKPGCGTPNPNWRKSQFIQAAIVAIVADCPNGPLPDKLNHTKLTDAVNARLQSDPAFAAFWGKPRGRGKPRGEPHCRGVTRQAVKTSLQMLRRANP